MILSLVPVCLFWRFVNRKIESRSESNSHSGSGESTSGNQSTSGGESGGGESGGGESGGGGEIKSSVSAVPELRLWALAMTMVAAVTLSPHSHVFDCVLLAIPAALTLPTLSLVDALRIEKQSLRWWSVTFIVFPILSWILNYSMPLLTSPIFFFIINVILMISGSIYTFGLMRIGATKPAQSATSTTAP
jgi:hypothetical protein